jgi:hypothetical protein
VSAVKEDQTFLSGRKQTAIIVSPSKNTENVKREMEHEKYTE